MRRFLKYVMLFSLVMFCFSNVALAKSIKKAESFTVNIPRVIKVEGIGPVAQYVNYGKPSNSEVSFDLLVYNSLNKDYWELTTNKPIGISVSYNTPGTIMAVFVSMKNASDGYVIPQDNLSIYPSKVFFDRSSKGGDSQRIFHFSPIIKVSKMTPPGSYSGTITFTVVGQ